MRPYLLMLLFLLVVSGLLLIDPEATAHMTKETGVIEVATAVMYVILIAMILFFAQPGWSVGKYWYALMAGLLLCRELDFDKMFTTLGIFKGRFYTSPDVPAVEKVVAIVVVLAIAGAVMFTFVKSRKILFEGIVKMDPIHMGILVAFCLAVISKLVLDGLPRKLEKIGVAGSDYLIAHHGKVEEVLELGIPMALIIATLLTQNKLFGTRGSFDSCLQQE